MIINVCFRVYGQGPYDHGPTHTCAYFKFTDDDKTLAAFRKKFRDYCNYDSGFLGGKAEANRIYKSRWGRIKELFPAFRTREFKKKKEYDHHICVESWITMQTIDPDSRRCLNKCGHDGESFNI